MGNALFSDLGIDIAALVADNLGPSLLPVVLHVPGPPGGRDSANPTRLLPSGPGTDHQARGLIEDFRTADIDGTLIMAGDRRVTLLGDTITPPLDPAAEHQLTIEGTRYNIYRVMSRDAAGATWILQVREP